MYRDSDGRRAEGRDALLAARRGIRAAEPAATPVEVDEGATISNISVAAESAVCIASWTALTLCVDALGARLDANERDCRTLRDVRVSRDFKTEEELAARGGDDERA